MVAAEDAMDPHSTTSDDAFHAFEHAGWERVPRQYDEAFATLTVQSIEPLLDTTGIGDGVRVLDVATGPGYAAAAAARRGADVVGLDCSAAMVAEARRQHPALDFREGDAEQLPFPDGSFDAVVMNFGLLHVPRPEHAVREAHRVLRPRGRFGFTVWAPPEQAVGLGFVLRAVQRHGDMSVPLPPGPPFFRFSESAECIRVLQDAGFTSPRVDLVPQVWRLRSPEVLFERMLRSTVRMGALLDAQQPHALDAIRDELREATAAFRNGDAIELPMPSVLASATKPR
jgi:ubiquinone/menaquinone biosynthesis C-methylase UbiE